jgi:beta-carotene 3-hydroxylase
MSILAGTAIALATLVGMEILAHLTHKYLMHGPGWGWHRSHHEPHESVLEKNDLYAVLFALLAIGLILFSGALSGPLYWVGLGMTGYGLLYFVVHDGLVHGRWPFRLVPKNPYLKRLVQAHRLHHAVEGREDCVSFGFLYAPPVRKLRQELRAKHGAALRGAPE